MSSNSGTPSASTLPAAAFHGINTANTRVRLLVAIPAVIVLLLCLMAGVFFWMTEEYLTKEIVRNSQSVQDFSKDWLIFMSIFIAAGALIGYTLAWSLTKPIRDIIKLSERVAGGDLRSKVDIKRQ